MWMLPLYLHVNQKSDDDDDMYSLEMPQEGASNKYQSFFMEKYEKCFLHIHSYLDLSKIINSRFEYIASAWGYLSW